MVKLRPDPKNVKLDNGKLVILFVKKDSSGRQTEANWEEVGGK